MAFPPLSLPVEGPAAPPVKPGKLLGEACTKPLPIRSPNSFRAYFEPLVQNLYLMRTSAATLDLL